MMTETFAAAALAVADAVAPADAVELADPPELAVLATLPQAASAIAHSAAGRTYGAQERARRKESLMVVLTHPAPGRFRGAGRDHRTPDPLGRPNFPAD
jgi:hypothetical protein